MLTDEKTGKELGCPAEERQRLIRLLSSTGYSFSYACEWQLSSKGLGSFGWRETCERLEYSSEAIKLLEKTLRKNRSRLYEKGADMDYTIRIKMLGFAEICFNASNPLLEKVVKTVMLAGKSLARASFLETFSWRHLEGIIGELRKPYASKLVA